MCLCYSKPKKLIEDVVVINEVEKEKEFVYLEPKGKIYCLRDLDFNVLILDIELEGWNPTQVRL